jgi:hypothetical protein
MSTNPIAFVKNPNPQGKGMVPVLRDWASMQPALAGPKAPAVFLRDYCLSSLVLSANFRFKPVVGNIYFLYAGEDEWSLSLIAPQEWGERKVGEFVARCSLRPDMTWEMDADLEEHSPALVRARQFILTFFASLATHRSISAHLPFYSVHLPYYRRLLATALSSSLQRSLPSTGDDVQALLDTLPGAAPLASPASVPALLAAGFNQKVL